MEKVTLGYWKIRGLGQFIRHLLAYTETPFQEVQYDNQDKWFKEDKTNLGLDFPNLPYLVDGEFKITESVAVAKYVIKRSGRTELLGKDTQDQGKVEALTSILRETNSSVAGLCFNPNHEEAKIEVLEKIRPKLNYIRDFVGDKKFALGYLTLVDFYLAEQLAYFEALYPSEHKNYGFWWRIRHHFEELPQIKAYYKREDAVHGPYLPPHALLTPTARKVKLGYWGIRGLGQVPRLLLSYYKVDFEDYHYTEADKWFKDDKVHLGLDFPNLPYLIDGEYSLTESSAIQRYVIQKWGNSDLLGKDAKDNALLESFLSIFTEVSGAIKGLFWNKEYEAAKGAVIEKHKAKLEQLNKFVGEKGTVLGYLTLADFIVAEDSHYIQRLFPEEIKAYPFLLNIREKFNALPEIQAYYASDKGFKGRFFPPYAAVSVEQE